MRVFCLIASAALVSPALGQTAAPAPVPQIAGVDEVIVRGRTGSRMRVELERIENAFYDRFNALNSRDELDIVCMNEAPVGSRMPVRECLPEFAWTAERRAAQNMVRRMQGDPYTTNSQIHFMGMDRKQQELVEEIQRLAREDEQLLRDLQRLAELQQAVGGRVGKRR